MSEAGPSTASKLRTAPAYAPLLIVLIGVVAGTAADRGLPAPVWLWWGAALMAWAAWLVLHRKGCDRAAALVVLVPVAAVAGAWGHLHRHVFAENEIGLFARDAPEPVCIEVRALKSPRIVAPSQSNPLAMASLEKTTRLDVALHRIRDGATWRAASGRTQLNVVGELTGVEAGDRLQVFGQLAKPQVAGNPGEFDFAAYLCDNRIHSQLRVKHPACITVLGPGSAWSLTRWLERLRAHGARLLGRYLDPHQAPLAAAVLLGERAQIEPDLTLAFMETGTVHILSISGMHVTILAGLLFFLLKALPVPRWLVSVLVAAGIVGYALMVDSQAPVVRAAVVVVVFCLAAAVRRGQSSVNVLAFAALVVLAINPADLFRVGTQLSFLCVAAMIWIAPKISRRAADADPLMRLIEANRGFWERLLRQAGHVAWSVTLVSTVIWLVTAPLVLARFQLLSPIALLLNTLIYWPVWVAMVSGVATIAIGTVCPPLAEPCGWLCNGSFRSVEGMVDLARSVPQGHLWLPGPADWWLAGFYGAMAVCVAFPRMRPSRRWCVGLLAAWIVVGFSVAWARQTPGRLTCSFLSMGHGSAVLVELPTGQTMLYDAGRLGAPKTAASTIAAVLWSKGITHLDAVVLSHSDTDHYNALPELLDRFSVGVIYVSPVMFEDMNPALDALHAAIERSGVPMRVIRAGDQLAVGGGCCMEVLHPPRNGILGSSNANSLVLTVEYRGKRILLPGDLEPPGFQSLLAEEPMHCDVLLVPHHGSQSSSPPGLAAWSTPDRVVISGSHRWETDAAEAAYASLGGQVLHTADCGAVEVVIDAEGCREQTFLQSERDRRR